MAGRTLDLDHILHKDQEACEIANKYIEWSTLRQRWLDSQAELRKYLFATDTTQTTNSKLPWKNKTTIPKLTQIRDNLLANYMAAIFPKRKWLHWLANEKDANSAMKRKSILDYMMWTIQQPQFKTEVQKCLMDFIDNGNAIGSVEWVDQRVESKDAIGGKIQTGYVGPVPRRIAPQDIVFNPISPSFYETPKITKAYMTLGELKLKLESLSTDENRKEYQEIFNYLKDYRQTIRDAGAVELAVKDDYLRMDGFESFHAYLMSDYVEIITFYGDYYNKEKNELLRNHVIMVADRHKLIAKKPNPSYFGYAPIFHAGWRVRQDNLWAMGPLDNLVGMQYRIDHIENLKADVLDLIAFPVLKVKGHVQDFEWGPMQRIYTDADSDVEMLAPPFQVLQMNNEIDYLEAKMEMMAGSPKEAMGFRTPGEKTAFEVQRLENAAGRIFQAKITQFEEQFIEPLLNAMLEMARRNIQGVQEINVFDDDFNLQTFLELSADDITGAGRLKPIGARHFAEKAEMVQNLNNFAQSGLGQDPMVMQHFSSIRLAKMVEDLLDWQDYELVTENVRIAEQQQAQQLSQIAEEHATMATSQSGGEVDDDFDIPMEAQAAAAEQVPPQEAE
jgi:hypothetical protein